MVLARGGLAPIIAVFIPYNLQVHMTRPFVPLYAASFDIGYLGVGIVAAAIGLLPIFVAMPVGSMTDRLGVRPMVVTGAVISATGFLALSLWPSLTMVLVAQVLAGLSNLLIGLGLQTEVGKLGKGREAEKNFSMLTIFASIGQTGGPLIGGFIIGVAGFPAAFGTAAALSVLCVIGALVLLPRTGRSTAAVAGDAAPRRAVDYLRDRDTQLAIFASCLMTVPEVLRVAFLPIYLGEVVHLDSALIGYVLAIFAIAGLVAKTALPRLVARFGRQVMLLTFTTCCGLVLLALPLSASLWMVGVITACMGLTFGLGRPLSMAMATNAATPGQEGFVMALRLSGNRLADFGLPIVFGAAASAVGIGGAFISGGVLLLAGAGVLIAPTIAEVREDTG